MPSVEGRALRLGLETIVSLDLRAFTRSEAGTLELHEVGNQFHATSCWKLAQRKHHEIPSKMSYIIIINSSLKKPSSFTSHIFPEKKQHAEHCQSLQQSFGNLGYSLRCHMTFIWTSQTSPLRHRQLYALMPWFSSVAFGIVLRCEQTEMAALTEPHFEAPMEVEVFFLVSRIDKER